MSDNKNVLIEVRDLCKSFDHVNVLNGISTTISQGEVVAIIGPSGCGKSTFLRSMNLLEKPTSGSILFEGTDITDSSGEDRHGVSAVQSVSEHDDSGKYHACPGTDRAHDKRRGFETCR